MGKIKDLKGITFGRLVVIERAGNEEGGRAKWLVQCICGKNKVVSSRSLINGNATSCGCYKREKLIERRSLNYGSATKSRLFSQYKTGAKRRGLVFELNIEQFLELTSRDCYYCGTEPKLVVKHKTNNGDYVYNGIDRVDSSKGYILENCVTCCETCNKAKLSASKEDFKSWIIKIYNNFVKGDNKNE